MALLLLCDRCGRDRLLTKAEHQTINERSPEGWTYDPPEDFCPECSTERMQPVLAETDKEEAQ